MGIKIDDTTKYVFTKERIQKIVNVVSKNKKLISETKFLAKR